MAQAAAAPQTPSSMRTVRDKYLNLLLSAPTPSPAPQPTPQPAWTPGTHFAPPMQPAWPAGASPVTPSPPGPTETDVRLAELAAGLVAAGGVEARQSDTIRRLADELHESQERLRTLEKATASVSARKPRRKHTARESQHTPRRTARFTPAGVERPREENELPRRRSAGDARPRSSASRDFRTADENFLREELDALKRERTEWIKERERSRRESSCLTKMLSGIKDNTKRLLEERDEHIAIIAQLRQEVGTCKRREAEAARRESDAVRMLEDAHRSGAARQRFSTPGAQDDVRKDVPPESLIGGKDRSSDFSQEQLHERDASPSSVRILRFEQPESHDRFGSRCVEEVTDDDDDIDFCTNKEDELREDLRLVLLENEKLSERIPQLEAECLDLSRRLRNTEKARISKESAQEASISPAVSSSPDHDVLREELVCLIEEVEILEGVSEAINFGVTPSEAECLEDTMTTLSIASENGRAEKQTLYGHKFWQCDVVQDLIRRLVAVRAGLSVRYGQWLKAIGEDESSVFIHGQLHVHDGLSETLESGNYSLNTMDTKLIDELIAED